MQGQNRRTYKLSLPLTRPTTPVRMERRSTEGYTVFVLRKEVPNSEWTHLIKEPAKSLYKAHMKVDYKMKFDRDDEDAEDDVWSSHEYRVEKVTQANVDDVITSARIVMLMFFPSWVHPQFSVHWAHQFALAAEALEGRAILASVNAQAETAASVLARFRVTISQHDGNYSEPVFRVLVDGGKLIPEGYAGGAAAQQLIEFVQRLEGVCDRTPCPAVHALKGAGDVDLLLGRHELTAIAVGFSETDALSGALTNVTRSLQAVGPPPYKGRAKGVGVGWVGDGPAFNTLLSQLKGIPKIDLRDFDFPALLLLRVPGAPAADASESTMAPPIMVTTASVIRPENQKSFKKAELRSAIGGWGFKQEGVREDWGTRDVMLAQRCGVSTMFLLVSPEAAPDLLGQQASLTETAAEASADVAALRNLRAYALENRSVPMQILTAAGANDQSGRMQMLAAEYGWVPAVFPALGIVRKGKLYALPVGGGGGKYDPALPVESIWAFARDVQASKFKALLRSDVASPQAGPATGEVDRVVATTAAEFVRQQQLGIDTVLAVYDSTNELSERRRGSLGKAANKMAHVSTLAFGALDTHKNDVPLSLAQAMGGDTKRFDGIWIFPAVEAGSEGAENAVKPAAPLAHRCKRKASTKEMAQCIRKHAAVPFPAKVPGLPQGPYENTCSRCAVVSARGKLLLRCQHCNGAPPTQTEAAIALDACSEFTNVDGQLGCAVASSTEL